MTQYRMLACDIDNTLVRFPDPPTPQTTAAIRAAVNQGTMVVLVTGRAFRRALPVAKHLGLDTPIICNHGGSIRDAKTGRVIHRETMPRALVREIVSWLQEQNVHILVFDEDLVYLDGLPAEIVPEFQVYARGPHTVYAPDLLHVLPAQTEIILSTAPDHDLLDGVYGRAQERFGDRTRVLFSHPFGVDMMPYCSKSQALAWLAAHYGFDQKEIMAVGDGFNDVDMVTWAGLGVAMGDGVSEVQVAADIVAPPFVHDGLAWAIEHYILSC